MGATVDTLPERFRELIVFDHRYTGEGHIVLR
jgi:hypothetical protein